MEDGFTVYNNESYHPLSHEMTKSVNRLEKLIDRYRSYKEQAVVLNKDFDEVFTNLEKLVKRAADF